MPGKKQVRLAFCDLAPDWDATRYRVPLHICTIRAAASCRRIWTG